MNLIADIIVWIAYLVSLYFSIFLLLVFLDKKTLLKNEEAESSPETLPQHPFISILIPAYNEEETIIKTLNSVEQLDYPQEKMQVIVINDGSRDHTKQKVEQYIKDKPYITLLSQPNRGKAVSLNRALKLAKGEFFACLDADSFVEPATLKKMLSFYYRQNDPSLAIVTPAMKVSQPKNILQKIQWLEYIVMMFIGRLSSQIDSLYVAPGPFSLYNTAIIQKLGGFDEQTLTEDQEIAYRVQQHHYRIKHCFDGYVYTTAPNKIRPFWRQRRRWYLGSITCLHQYRSLVANKKYGDFGLMQLVKNVMGFVLAITGLTLVGYLFIRPLFIKVKNLLLIHFNIVPYLLNLKLHITQLTLLLINFRKSFVLFFLVLLGWFFFYYAHKNAREKITKVGWIPLIPYALYYYLLKGIILLVSLTQFSRSRKVKW